MRIWEVGKPGALAALAGVPAAEYWAPGSAQQSG